RIYRLAGTTPYFTASSRACTVSNTTRSAVQLTCPHPALLTRRETDLAGWSADVDGHPARLQRVDGLFQAVAVAAGTHRIRFAYSPPYIGWAFAAFATGCAWLLLAGTAGRRARTSQRSTSTESTASP